MTYRRPRPNPIAPGTRRSGLLAIALLVAAFGCAGRDEPSGPETLTIASDATFAPFHYLSDGRATGFDIELAIAMAERAGFEPIVVVEPYDRLFTGLLDGAHDVIAATTGITPERELEYGFGHPYFETAQAALVRAGPGEPRTLGDLAGRRVGASGAGTSARAMRQIVGAIHVSLGAGEATESVIEEGRVSVLEDNEIDALIVDEFDAVAAARASGGRLAVLPRPVASESYAFVLRLGETRLKARLDAALDALEREGVLDSLRIVFGVSRDATWPVVIGGRN